jgi:hypothetical protein
MRNKAALTGLIGFVLVFGMLVMGCHHPNNSVKSSNALLKYLSIRDNDTELIPTFDASLTAYTATVPYITNTVTISAEPSDDKAHTSYSSVITDGLVYLDKGTNTIIITVTAEDGTTREYTVNITVDNKFINSFVFKATDTGLTDDLIGTIDESLKRITIATQEWIGHIESLKAVFEAAGVVTIDNTIQESGITPNNFCRDVVYTVTAEDNAQKTYTVVFESPQATGLPVIRIDTQGSQSITSKETYVNAAMVIQRDGVTIHESTMRIRGRGNATWGYPKKPYKIKLDSKANILGMGNDKDWVLLANYCDKSLMRTGIAFKVSELLQFPWTPDAKFVELVINGEYQGNYQLVEGIKQDSNRVDIPKTGFIIENDGYYLQEPKWFVTDSGHPYSFKNPDAEDDLTDAQYNYIKDYLNEFEGVLNSDNFNDAINGYQKYIDTDSFVRWFLLQQIIANLDTNPYLIKADSTENSKLSIGPVWDFEWSMGIGWYDGARPRPADYWTWNGWYYEKLLQDEAFTARLRSMWDQYKGQISQTILQYIDERESEIMKSQKINFRRWDILNTRVSVGGIPLGSFEAEVDCDKQFFINHMNWLETAIAP